jgi:hypothetical protein
VSGPLTARVGELTGRRITGERPVGGGSICDARRLTAADGTVVFAKTLDSAPPGFFAAEADGLALLGGTAADRWSIFVTDLPGEGIHDVGHVA